MNKVSKCCKVKAVVKSDQSEGTNYYECTKCHQPCDVVEPDDIKLPLVVRKEPFKEGTINYQLGYEDGRNNQRDADQIVVDKLKARIAQLDEYQRGQDKLIEQKSEALANQKEEYMMMNYERDNWKQRVEALEIANGNLDKRVKLHCKEVVKLQAEIAKLKKYDIRQWIPKGKWCSGCVFSNENEWCDLLLDPLHSGGKLPSCPKPYVEEKV